MRYVYDEQHVGYFMSIAGDDNRYLQILLNFLSNALKFTPAHGTINVEVRLVDTQEKSSKGGVNAEEPAGDIRKMKL
jgi:signal transduction histidine kinase